MATLVPTLSSLPRSATPGERRLAQRLVDKLEDDYLCWYNVPLGPRQRHPDFVLLHPGRGLLVLEVKDWKRDQIQRIDRTSVSLLTDHGLKEQANPLEQARAYAMTVVNLLARDPLLVVQAGRYQGQLILPWGYGVVLTNISRKAFDQTDLGEVIDPALTICQDEMTESVDAEAFQMRLWAMFKVAFAHTLTLPQIDRIRWHLFPEIRVTQGSLLPEPGEAGSAPDLVRVMMTLVPPHPSPLPRGERGKTRAPGDPRGGGLGQDDDPGLPGGLVGPGAGAADPGALLQRRPGRQAAAGDRRSGVEREGERLQLPRVVRGAVAAVPRGQAGAGGRVGERPLRLYPSP